jgi:uncharacterized damage-inducible protein DinB
MRYYATCNKEINAKVGDLIEGRVEDPLKHGLDGYFFTTLGMLLEHVYRSDRVWMATFLGLADHGIDIEGELGALPPSGAVIFGDFTSYRKARARLDDCILDYMGRLVEEDLWRITTKVTSRGERMERVVWKALLHFFNHQTHHRGQVSGILDGLHIENNFSNMIFID